MQCPLEVQEATCNAMLTVFAATRFYSHGASDGMHLQLLALQAFPTLHVKDPLNLDSVRPDLGQQSFKLQEGSHNMVWQLARLRAFPAYRSGAIATHQTGEAEM